MIKKKYKALEILKKIKRKDLISGLSSLSSEKDKLYKKKLKFLKIEKFT